MLDLLYDDNNNNNNNNSNMEKNDLKNKILSHDIFEYSHANASTMWIIGPLNQGNNFYSKCYYGSEELITKY